LNKNQTIWYYKIHRNEIYNIIDFIFDYNFWFLKIKSYLKFYKILILIISIIVSSIIFLLIITYSFLTFFYYLTIILYIKLFNKNLKIIFPAPSYDPNLKTSYKLIKYNLQIISLKRVLKFFKLTTKSKFNFKNLLIQITELLWYFTYILIFGKSLNFFKIFLWVVDGVLIKTVEQIKTNKLNKIFKIRLRIYKKYLFFNFNWYGSQFFFKTYCNYETEIIFEFNKGKLIFK